MSIAEIAAECTRASDEERASFPQIIAALAKAGVERYHADLVRSVKTYYTPAGDAYEVKAHRIGANITQTFSAADVEAAVRGSQSGVIKYQEFCKRIAAAGCAGYLVTLLGRRAVYYGRDGETHVEHFPLANARQ